MAKHSAGEAEDAVVWRPAHTPGLEVAVKSAAGSLHFPASIVMAHCIALSSAGSAEFTYGKTNHRLPRADGLVLLQRPGELFHGTFSTEHARVGGACIELSSSLVKSLEDQLEAPGALEFRDAIPRDEVRVAVEGLTRRLIEASRRPQVSLESDTLLLALATTLGSPGPTEVAAAPRHRRRMVSQVRDMITDMPHLDHRLKDLAATAAMNPRYFISAFRREVGITPHQYLLHVRIHQAKHQLAAGTAISEVAVSLGFSDQSHLTRVFRRHVRTTPARFQRLSSSG
jgi:AraC-like DNA-binding protein